MNQLLKKFIIKLLVISLIFSAIAAIVFIFFIPNYFSVIYPVSLIVFLIFTIIVFAYQLKLVKTNIGKFMRMNMVLTFIKLIVYSAYTIIYLAINAENAIPFVVFIMLVYAIFTTTEVSDMAKIARNQKNNS